MLSSVLSRPKFFNKELHDYCLKSTKESIQKLVEKKEAERKLIKLNLNLETIVDNSNPDDNNIFPFICFLSISSFILYFYRQKN